MSAFFKSSIGLLGFAFALTLAGCSLSEDRAKAVELDGTPLVGAGENLRAEALFDQIYMARLARSPIEQAFEGNRDQQHLWDDLSEEFALETQQLNKGHLVALQRLNAERLSDANQLNVRLYQQELETDIKAFQWSLHRYPISHMSGLHTGVATILIRLHRIESVEDANAYILRLRKVPELFDQLIDGLNRRAEQNIFAPKFVYENVIDSAQGIIKGYPFTGDSDDSSPLMADIKRKLAQLDLAEEDKQALEKAAETALLEFFGPAYRKLIAALETLQDQADFEGGAWKLPQGKAFYQHALRKMTTTELDADQIHRLGLSEVARIHEEMRALVTASGFQGELAEFFVASKTNPELFFPQTPAGKQAYIDAAEQAISNMQQRLPQLFGLIPKAQLSVKAVESFREQGSVGSAYYQQGAPDGSRPGVFYVNTYDMSLMPKHTLQSFAYHEGIPGHHMQVSIAQELTNVPKFRRAASYVAYSEGWGLYAELLPKEMGLYADLYADFGRLSAELWRACRLVVDTGLHDKQWGREQAIQYLMDTTPTEHKAAVKAVDRYLVMPAQATAYKIGMLKILELRQRAKEQLGDQFDLRGFHDVVLGNGALPLNILEEIVNQWIENLRSKQELAQDV